MTGAAPGAGLLRPRFFDRQQLGAADLTLAQEYVIERLRRHNRFVHGWGVIYGADVTATSDPMILEIGPGYALTPLGDEIYIPGAVSFNITDGVQACLPGEEPCSDLGGVASGEDAVPAFVCADVDDLEPGAVSNPLTRAGMIFDVFGPDGERFEQASITTIDDTRGLGCGNVTEVTLPFASASVDVTVVRAASHVRIRAFNSAGAEIAETQTQLEEGGAERLTLAGTDITRLTISAPNDEAIIAETCAVRAGALRNVYLVACPQTEFFCPAPSVPAACHPPGGTYEWSRVRESCSFTIVCDLPASHQPSGLTCEDYTALLCSPAVPPLPPVPEDNCVVLATLTVGGPVPSIDVLTHRRRLLNESLEHQAVQCLCEQQPVPTQPTQVPTVTIGPVTQITPTPTFTIGPITDIVATIPSHIFVTDTIPTLRPTDFFPTDIVATIPSHIIATEGPIFEPTGGIVIGPGGIIGLDPVDFDLIGGARAPVERIPGIGPERGARLRNAGVGSVLDLAAMPVDQLTEVLGVSEVRAAGFQDAARHTMRR